MKYLYTVKIFFIASNCDTTYALNKLSNYLLPAYCLAYFYIFLIKFINYILCFIEIFDKKHSRFLTITMKIYNFVLIIFLRYNLYLYAIGIHCITSEIGKVLDGSHSYGLHCNNIGHLDFNAVLLVRDVIPKQMAFTHCTRLIFEARYAILRSDHNNIHFNHDSIFLKDRHFCYLYIKVKCSRVLHICTLYFYYLKFLFVNFLKLVSVYYIGLALIYCSYKYFFTNILQLTHDPYGF